MNLGFDLTPTLAIALYAALLSTLVFCWNLYRDLRDKGRLKVHADIRDVRGPAGPILENQVAIRVTNIGRRSVYVTNMGAAYRRTGLVFFTWNPLPRELKPGELMDELTPAQDIRARELRYIWVKDSTGRYYKVPKLQGDTKRLTIFQRLQRWLYPTKLLSGTEA